ncbi:Clp protease N-terminal domain-containing protein [Streptomyces venezuelae]|uniref:Peptidase n=1 Tax=Streptomyces venezuelae TaxID=54571 RepID=A0A5P2AYN1_STRVZ|nr:peptidase [Streptomyces venezuelae]
MHRPVPLPQPPRQPVAPRAELTSFLSFLTPSLATVVTGARRRALRDGDRQIDTAHLLHALVESDPDVGAVFESGHQLARVLGYLAQRSIGYGLRWQRSVEESGARRLLPAAREAESRREPRDESRRESRGDDGRSFGWSPAAAAALEGAFRRAARRGDERARGLDLLVGVAADPENRAVEVLRRAGVDPGDLIARIDAGMARGGDPGAGGGIEACGGGAIDAPVEPRTGGRESAFGEEPSQQV